MDYSLSLMFSAQGFANTAWAYAKAVQSDAPLPRTLARVAERRVGDISAQEPANTVWLYAKGQLSDAPLFVVLVMVAERRGGDFSAQERPRTVFFVVFSPLDPPGIPWGPRND